MQTECIPGNIYIHYRNQKKYIVTHICKHGSFDSNLPHIAIYHQLDEEGRVYYRDIANFNEVVTWNQDGNVWRYKYLSNLNDLNSSSVN